MDTLAVDDALWAQWVHARSQRTRDELVARYTELVRILSAKTFRHRYSEELEFSDYMQFGMIGLLEAIDRYDPTLGHKFETFASHRIQGAILNGVENLSEKQQQIATRQRVRAERARSLADGVASREARSGTEALHQLADIAIGLAMGFMLDNAGLYLDGEPASGDTPYEQVELAQLRRRLSLLVEQLPAQERKVIRSHYFQQVQFEEVARTMSVTKGRVSQIHHAALKRLREMHAQADRFSLKT